MTTDHDWTSRILGFFALLISIVGVFLSRRQANAAERQSDIAQEQATLALADAEEAKRIAKLSEVQMKAALRPILKVVFVQDSYSGNRYYIENGGEGPAKIEHFNTRYPAAQAPYLESKLVPARSRIEVKFDRVAVKIEGLEIRFLSEDGRRFETIATIVSSNINSVTFTHHDREL